MSIRLEELRRRADAIAGELADIREEIHRVETDKYVQVQFHGHAKRYTYELPEGHVAQVGDYVAVFSPYSDQTELVRVVEKGRGGTALRPLKLASQIDWAVRPGASR